MYPGMFRDYDNRVGKAWLREIDKENRKVFGQIGYAACANSLDQFGNRRGYQFLPKVGGTVRAKTAKRNKRGRFVK